MHKRNPDAGPVRPAFSGYFAIMQVSAIALALLLALFHHPARSQVRQLPVTSLSIDSHTITAEVAATGPSRSYGLMHRASLPPDTGMLFIFEAVGRPCFWMKNTPLPLSIAFIDQSGIIVNTADMQPHSTDSHCPAAPILYALEMEQGWFESRNIRAGARVNNLPQP